MVRLIDWVNELFLTTVSPIADSCCARIRLSERTKRQKEIVSDERQ
jgi:hypothetical protein